MTKFLAQQLSEQDEIVISGISGKFPDAKNMAELSEKLYNKIDMVNDAETRWKHGHLSCPRRMGKIDDLDKFDSIFFGFNSFQANTMDPQGRLLMECAYEAILDAGVCPKTLIGSNTGVFVTAGIGETDKVWMYDQENPNANGVAGCHRALLANRISFSLGLNGPSLLVDTACSSSFYALDLAFRAVKTGECDAAVVAGVNLLLHPRVTIHYYNAGILAHDGYSRPFDNDAHGYVRSESVCAIFLQRAHSANRIYASLIYTKTNSDGHKEEGLMSPSSEKQSQMMRNFYNELQMDPKTVGYLECHMTGTSAGDPIESRAVDSVYCVGRDEPLLVGSVKSNLGHSEAAAGLCSLAKIILAFQTNLIPPNINFSRNREAIEALMAGRMKVVTEPTTLKNTLVAANSFGFGGSNAHVLVRGYNKKHTSYSADQLPRILVWTGRTHEACTTVLDSITMKPINPELMYLLNNTQRETTTSNIFRSYAVYQNNDPIMTKEITQNPTKRPIVWVFSGMGSQWSGMGTSLMKMPIFKATIDRLQKHLDSVCWSRRCFIPFFSRKNDADKIDLVEILTSQNPKIFDNILNCFIGIAAMQVAIVNILRVLELTPDYIIGHSAGELACAYGDECLSEKEVILCAYSRGMSVIEGNKTYGAMAAIGIGYKDIGKILPYSIDAACHNSPDSTTISGPSDDVKKFVKELQSKDIFAREVAVSNIPFHSRYIASCRENLLERLQKIIPDPKLRSSKWLSTSVAKKEWVLPENTLCSAEYQMNNMLNPVLFEETLELLPKDSLLIEISPSGLLQANLKRSMTQSLYINLTKRNSPDSTNFFYSAIGKLFNSGLDLNVNKLNPSVNLPVSCGTPMISPLIRWDHSTSWFVAKYDLTVDAQGAGRICKVNLDDSEYEFIEGHVINDRVLYPASGYLMLVHETFGMMLGRPYTEVIVEFQSVKFLRVTTMSKNMELTFNVVIQRGTGSFEITENDALICSGVIKETEQSQFSQIKFKDSKEKQLVEVVDQENFYKELRIRGYQYKNNFKQVVSTSIDGSRGQIKWLSNFVAFVDCILQLNLFHMDTRKLLIPTSLERIRINPQIHLQMAEQSSVFDVECFEGIDIARTGGIEVHKVKYTNISRKKQSSPINEKYEFVPHFSAAAHSMIDAARFCMQIMSENTQEINVTVLEVESHRSDVLQVFSMAISQMPQIVPKLMMLTTNIHQDLDEIECHGTWQEIQSKCNFIVLTEGVKNQDLMRTVAGSLKDKAYVLSREDKNVIFHKNTRLPENFELISSMPNENETWLLFQYRKTVDVRPFKVVRVSNSSFMWLTEVKNHIDDRLLLFAQNEPSSGLLGLINCIRAEPGGMGVSCVLINDPLAPNFDVTLPFYKNHLSLGLAINVYKNGQWGTYRHSLLHESQELKPEIRQCYVNCMAKGDLSSLKWQEQLPVDKFKLKNLVQVQYASLNFRDVMLATGKLSDDFIQGNRCARQCVMGLEFSGNMSGRRVMGIVSYGALATHVKADPELVWTVPDNWSLEDAATVPLVYLTVYTSFFLKANIQGGQKILIHAGTGGVGLAAIRVALAYGLEVFTTVSTQEKRNYLLNLFPQLKSTHIGNSRDLSFYEMIMQETNAEGVDYVLNSLAEEKLLTSVKCLAQGGHFLEIGKFDITNDTKMGLAHFINEITFHVVMVENIFNSSLEKKQTAFKLIQRDLKSQIIVPLKANVFEAEHVEKAFSFLASGKHMGKVVLKIRKNDTDDQTLPIHVLSRVYCDPNLTYIIVGGLGGFGLELADWLVLRGCKKLVLSSRRGITNNYQSFRINIWKSYGVAVEVATTDVTTHKSCIQFIQDATKMGSVGGIFNLAVQLKDAVLQNQTELSFKQSLAPKALATMYLDEVSQKLCPKLHLFVVFSSVSCGRGTAGQTNYGMANSIMERIVEARRAKLLPGKAIQWGAIGDVGLIISLKGDASDDSEVAGTVPQRISSCLEELDVLLTHPAAVVASMVVAEKKDADKKAQSENLLDAVMKLLGVRDSKSIAKDTKLSKFGMDSLLAIEVGQMLEREFGIFLTGKDIRQLTLNRLHELNEEHKKQ